ncbi:MAG: hypothetical protein QW785_01400 [Candidatus Anstonellales archaeon]
MGIIDIIIKNLFMLALGLGIGLAIAVLIYFYNLIFKKDQAKSLDAVKDVIIVVFYLVLLFAIDLAYNLFLSAWLGIPVGPGDNLRIAEAVIYKDIDKFRETLMYIYIADFVINLFGSFSAHLHAAINPEMTKLQGLSPLNRVMEGMTSLLRKASLDPYKAEMGVDYFYKMNSAIQLLYNASYGLFLVLVYKYIKLTVITYLPLIMSIFIPLGLVLIFIPITRKVGMTIVGLAVTLYYLFPVFIIYSDTVLRNMPDFDHRYISAYISPTIVEFLDKSSGSNPATRVGYKYAFIEREKAIQRSLDYIFLEQDRSNIMEPDQNNPVGKLEKEGVGVFHIYSFVDAQSVCDPGINDKEVCREYQTANIGDYRSENVLAPLGSLYANTVKYSAIVRVGTAIKEVISTASITASLNPFAVALINILGMAINMFLFAIQITQVLPIPGLSQVLYGALNIPFLPFLMFRTALEAALIAYKIIIYGSITIFLDIFLIITGYRAVASIIGAEQRILGLEKVL